MTNFLKYVVRFLRRWFVIDIFLKKRFLKKRYKTEIDFLQKKIRPSSERKSIVFFTMHKTASCYVGDVIKKIAWSDGLLALDFTAYFFDLIKESEGLNRIAKDKSIFVQNGCFFGPFRRFYEPFRDNIDKYDIILMLRDPRDVLVSQYYSFSFKHRFPIVASYKELKKEKEKRKLIADMGVDNYVLHCLDSGSLDIYREYADVLLGRDNVLFLRYEDMYDNFDLWLSSISDFFDFSDESVLEDIKKRHNEKRFDLRRGAKQVLKGDYKEKLRGDTIKKLNEECEDVLKIFGFSK